MQWKQLLVPNRPRKSTLAPDHREEFERDLDRSVFSTPVKRLQDKTQVFPLDPNDAVRTRLTHSMEVSCVARGLARSSAGWLLENKLIDPGMDRQIEAIAATCGLIHDLGNPPFGHSAESCIQEWFRSNSPAKTLGEISDVRLREDFLTFDGNAQTLRLVGKLQVLADLNGLNLTYGTLSASCKYVAASHQVDKAKGAGWKKPGYFASERALVKNIREATGTGDARNPIAFLVEAADDIVYSVADIEDAIKKGILDWEQLKKLLEADKDPACAISVQAIIGTHDKILAPASSRPHMNVSDDTHAAAFRTAAIGVIIRDATRAFEDEYHSIMNGEFSSDLIAASKSKALVARLKRIGVDHVYCTHPTIKLELMGRRIVTDLLDLFLEGALALPATGSPDTRTFSGKACALLSSNYKTVFQAALNEAQLPEAYLRLQLVTDHICGMTDSFAQRLHAELTNG